MGSIEEAIKQKKFQSEKQKAHINVLYTGAFLSSMSSLALKPFQISWQQFNILRILKGLEPEPATVKVLTERMIDKMSNASRLVDKLFAKGYVSRESCKEDRRRVHVLMTDKGREMLEKASLAMDQMLSANLGGDLTEDEFVLLNNLLDRMRG